MPTKSEREYYRMGFKDGQQSVISEGPRILPSLSQYERGGLMGEIVPQPIRTTKRKLSAWNKYVKANSKKPRFRYRNGKLNLKKMAISFRKTPAGKKRRK